MNSLWQRLLGMQRSPGAEAAGETRLEFTALPKGGVAVAVVFGAVALLALLWWLYRRESRDLTPAKRVLLVGLRTLTIAAVVAMLVEPVLISSHRETVKSRLAIVLDDSESMRFADPYTDDTRAVEIATALKLPSEAGRPPIRRLRETTRLELVKTALRPHLEALARGREVTIDDLDSAAKNGAAKAKSLDAMTPSRPVSPVGDALGGALANLRGQAVAGLVLATDGRSNTGEDPMKAAEAAVRQNVPIFLIAAGGDEGPRNVRVAEVEASPVVFAKDPMTLAVVVEARGLKDAEATLVLEQRANQGDWEPVTSQKIPLGEDGILKRTSFRITPKVVGDYEYRARVEDAGPELTLEDNVATAAVRVVRQQIRLLLIAGAPSPEVQFLHNALMRDQHVEFAGWLQHADPGYRQAGDRPISRLPNDQEELRKYDALLLVDPDMKALGPQWPEMITKFVGSEGGGLVFVAGELHSPQIFDAEDGKSEGLTDWPRPPGGPVPVRGRGPPQLSEHVHARPHARGPRRPGVRVPRRPDPQPGDPDEPARHVLELPRHPRPPGRDRARPPRRPADVEPVRPARAARLAALRAGPDGVHRVRQHLPMAIPVRGLLRRLLGAPGRSCRPQQGPRRPVPVPGPPGQGRVSRGRPGADRRPLHRVRRAGRRVRTRRRA